MGGAGHSERVQGVAAAAAAAAKARAAPKGRAARGWSPKGAPLLARRAWMTRQPRPDECHSCKWMALRGSLPSHGPTACLTPSLGLSSTQHPPRSSPTDLPHFHGSNERRPSRRSMAREPQPRPRVQSSPDTIQHSTARQLLAAALVAPRWPSGPSSPPAPPYPSVVRCLRQRRLAPPRSSSPLPSSSDQRRRH